MSGFNLSHDHVSHSKPAEPLAEPLGLTVHSMPVPGQGVAMPGASRKGGRLKMLIVLLVCAAPVIASYFAYYVVRPEGRRNFGELITPQRPVIDAQAVTLNGTSVALPTLKGQWLLISVASGLCDVKCEKQLYLQRQVLTGLGKDRDRFDWVWLISDNQAVRPALLPGLKDAVLLRLPLDQVARWLSPAPGQQLSDHLYVVDPMGNWMMRFPADLNADGALKAKKDLERLLRASASWDQAGREGK
jgi:hypothetical protein